jgi:hypothetical protein
MKKLIIGVLFFSAVAWSQVDDASDESKTELIGGASYQGGQVFSGTYSKPNDINNYWYQKIFANVGFRKRVNDWLTVTAALEAGMRVSFKQGNTFPESQKFSPDIYIDEARGDLTFLESEQVNLNLTLGYFRFQYNEDVRNLGNNMFKSYCYPTAIVQPEFDFPYTRLCGLNFKSTFLDGLIYNDFLATVHVNFYPTNDLSLADIVGVNWRGIKLGVGLQLDRILPMNDMITTPKNVAMKVDPDNSSDTTYYTYGGTKFMTCLNLDLKKVIFGDDFPSIFGENDAKLFFELNVLGLKNYYYFYENMNERIPIAFGFLLPTFKILDVFSLEFEYFPSRYPNSIDRPMNANNPYPDIQEGLWDPEDFKNDDWKWSVYAKKSFTNFAIIGQIARDHLQLWSTRQVDMIYRDNLVESDDYYYQLKLQFNF